MMETERLEEKTARTVDAVCLAQVAQVHLQAFPSSLLTHLGMDFTVAYYRWHTQERYDPFLLLLFFGEKLHGFCLAGSFSGSMAHFQRRYRLQLVLGVLRRPAALRLSLSHIYRRIRHGATPQGPLHSGGEGKRSRNILALAVLPESQGKGLGRILMRAMEANAFRVGYERMHLSVDTANLAARSFYERLGYGYVVEDGAWNGRMARLLEGPGAG